MSKKRAIFKQKIAYESLGGYIVAHIVAPTKICDETPILFMPGWGAAPATVADFSNALAEKSGQSVWVLDHERLDACSSVAEKNYASVPCLEYTKAVGMCTIMHENPNIAQFDILTHSEGSVAGIVATRKSPGRCRNIILVNPAGLLASDSLGGLLYRFVHAVYSHVHDSRGVAHTRSVRLWENVLRYVLTNPIQTLREAFSLPYCDIRIYVKDMGSASYGKLTLLLSKNDLIFPTRSIRDSLKNSKNLNIIEMPGNHIQMFIDASLFATIISTQIKEYENH